MSLDEANTKQLRGVLDDILTDHRFITQGSISAVQLAEHIWRQAATGDHDLDEIKKSAFRLLNA